MTIWRTKTRRGEPVRKSESLLQHRGRERSYSRSRSPSPRREPVVEARPSENSVEPSLLAEVIRELAVVRAPDPSRPPEVLPPADLSQDQSPNINDPHTRAPTVLELILAIAKGYNVNRRFSCDEDNDTQAFAVPRTYRPALQLLHQLTVALSPARVFSPTQLGHSDLVAIDILLHDDLFGHIRSIFTKEIYPTKSEDLQDAKAEHLPALLISGHLNGLVELTAQATSYLQELAHRPQPNPDALLDRMADLFHYIHNINHRRQAVSTQLTAILFTPVDELQRKLNLLATHGVTLEKIVTNNFAAAAAVAQMVKAYDTYHDILKEHLITKNIGQERSVIPSATAQKVVQQAIAAALPPSEAEAKPPQAEPRPTTSNPQQSTASSHQSLDETAQLPSVATAHFDPEPKRFANQETSAASSASSPPPRQPAAPQDGALQPIPRERQEQREEPMEVVPVEVGQREPEDQRRGQQSEETPTRCYFCRQHHFSSGCPVYRHLSQKMEINARRGGCFLCCDRHAEEECPFRGRRCRGCRSKHHETSFCFNNRHGICDIEPEDYRLRLEQYKALADLRRRGDRGARQPRRLTGEALMESAAVLVVCHSERC